MSAITDLPRTVVRAYLSAARLPLDAVARVRGQADNERWPPALAFEGLEAGVEAVLGSLLRDDALVESGRLRQAKVAQLRKAEELETVADAAREQARETFVDRREAADRKRQHATAEARRREQQIERDEQRAKAQAAKQAAKRTQGASAARQAEERVIERQEQALTTEALAEEASALDKQQQALEAADAVDRIDAAIEVHKQARSN